MSISSDVSIFLERYISDKEVNNANSIDISEFDRLNELMEDARNKLDTQIRFESKYVKFIYDVYEFLKSNYSIKVELVGFNYGTNTRMWTTDTSTDYGIKATKSVRKSPVVIQWSDYNLWKYYNQPLTYNDKVVRCANDFVAIYYKKQSTLPEDDA